MSRSPTSNELKILSAVIAPNRADLTPGVARSILRWKFPAKAVAKMNRLAARNSAGTITQTEREELESFIRVGSLVNLAQAKARRSLERSKAH